MLDKIRSQLTHYWPLLALLLWGGAVMGFGLVNFGSYGVDEGAAMALLLNWSIADQIVSPVGILGGPDFRALLFVPLGLYWSGSMIAAKVYALLLAFAAILILYHWSREQHDHETALIASGLLLIAPLMLMQIDALGTGPFLLLLFALGRRVDHKYRANERAINSWYFVQAILVAITVTLHPAGLAYPLALAWHWYRNPINPRRKKQVWIGIAIATAIVAMMQTGWVALDWFSNPLTSLAQIISGAGDPDPLALNPLWGLIPGILLLLLVIGETRALLRDYLGSALLLGVLLGLLAANTDWALLALVLLLYRGVPRLIALNTRLAKGGFLGHRGLVMIVILVVATLFMQLDKAYAMRLGNGLLSPRDLLTQDLALEAENAGEDFLAASQWPARSMLAVRHNVLPLPPAQANGETLLPTIGGLTHVMFDHRDPRNTNLARNFAELAGVTETLTVQPGGVIIKISAQTAPPANSEPDATPEEPAANSG